MIEYIYENNIDIRALNKASNILNNGGLVAFPTESSWSIGCSIESKDGLEKVKKLKGDKKIYIDKCSLFRYPTNTGNGNFN